MTLITFKTWALAFFNRFQERDFQPSSYSSLLIVRFFRFFIELVPLPISIIFETIFPHCPHKSSLFHLNSSKTVNSFNLGFKFYDNKWSGGDDSDVGCPEKISKIHQGIFSTFFNNFYFLLFIYSAYYAGLFRYSALFFVDFFYISGWLFRSTRAGIQSSGSGRNILFSIPPV